MVVSFWQDSFGFSGALDDYIPFLNAGIELIEFQVELSQSRQELTVNLSIMCDPKSLTGLTSFIRGDEHRELLVCVADRTAARKLTDELTRPTRANSDRERLHLHGPCDTIVGRFPRVEEHT